MHKLIRSCLLGSLLLLLPISASANLSSEETTTITRAIEALDAADQDNNWRFTLTFSEDGEERVVTHDPDQPPYQQRTLLLVDGQPPSKDQLKAFEKQEKKRVDDRDPEATYAYLINTQSVQVDSSVSSETGVVYSFIPRIDALEKNQTNMRGRFLLNGQSKQIDYIEIYNAVPFSPAFSVTLENYQLRFDFRQEQNVRLLNSLSSLAEGKAGFLKSFQNRVEASFSDYQPALR